MDIMGSEMNLDFSQNASIPSLVFWGAAVNFRATFELKVPSHINEGFLSLFYTFLSPNIGEVESPISRLHMFHSLVDQPTTFMQSLIFEVKIEIETEWPQLG